MKNTIATKDYNYSLHNIENYNKELNTNINEIVKKYLNLLVEYYKFIIENIKIKNKQFTRFIITRGLDTITNVFLNLLLYTKNADLTYFHCQKSFYFYVEFVGQISEDEKMFLQLTSRDASTYVYKKNIFEINHDITKNISKLNKELKNKLDVGSPIKPSIEGPKHKPNPTTTHTTVTITMAIKLCNTVLITFFFPTIPP